YQNQAITQIYVQAQVPLRDPIPPSFGDVMTLSGIMFIWHGFISVQIHTHYGITWTSVHQRHANTITFSRQAFFQHHGWYPLFSVYGVPYAPEK
ncbi:hypothetical protein ACWKX9_26840, partial [Enterobacter asburiae]